MPCAHTLVTLVTPVQSNNQSDCYFSRPACLGLPHSATYSTHKGPQTQSWVGEWKWDDPLTMCKIVHNIPSIVQSFVAKWQTNTKDPKHKAQWVCKISCWERAKAQWPCGCLLVYVWLAMHYYISNQQGTVVMAILVLWFKTRLCTTAKVSFQRKPLQFSDVSTDWLSQPLMY